MLLTPSTSPPRSSPADVFQGGASVPPGSASVPVVNSPEVAEIGRQPGRHTSAKHTPPSFADVDNVPLDTDDAVRERVAALLERAMRRQLWMMFLDAKAFQLPLLMPSSIPRHPGKRHTENFAHFVSELVDELDAAAVVFVLERPGSDAMSETDREWFRLAVDGCQRVGVPLRGPLLCHDGGLRWIATEDVGQI